MVCIVTGYTGRKFDDFLGLSKLERCVGCIEGLQGRMREMERWLCGFNRSWLYQEERGPSFMREKSRKPSKIARIQSRKIAKSRELVQSGQKMIFYRLEASEQAKSSLNEPKQKILPVSSEPIFSYISDTKQTVPCIEILNCPLIGFSKGALWVDLQKVPFKGLGSNKTNDCL